MTAPLLRLIALRARAGGAETLRGADLRVAAGEVVGLIGPNGAGKTTLMRAALGLIAAEGDRRLGDAPLAALTPAQRARRAAFLPQQRIVGWPVTVATLVALGRAPYRRAGRAPDAADAAAVAAAMARMDLAALADRPADRLSGGELARALIARALAQDAPLLLADEPAAGLDPAHQLALMAALRDLARDGRGVLVSLHDLGLAARWCDRLAVLHRGRVVADGPPRAVLTPALLARVYGVRAHVAEGQEGLIVQVTGPA